MTELLMREEGTSSDGMFGPAADVNENENENENADHPVLCLSQDLIRKGEDAK